MSTAKYSAHAAHSGCNLDSIRLEASQTLHSSSNSSSHIDRGFPHGQLWFVIIKNLARLENLSHDKSELSAAPKPGSSESSKQYLHVLSVKQMVLQQLRKGLLRGLLGDALQGFWEWGVPVQAPCCTAVLPR